jgi:osmotically-inducible protein OsmY
VTAVRRANLPVSNLVVRSVEGIAVMRGEAPNRETADRAAATVRLAGFQRVANLIRVQAAPDDDAIRRAAERKLTQFTGLNGCTFFVSADGGVLHVRGEVQSPEQEDLTRRALRSIPGVHRVETEFVRPQAASS